MSKVIFSFNGIQTIIQCLKEDKMKDICQKFTSKIDIDINSIFFLYGGNKLNLELTFQQHANSFDKNNNQMNILVYKYDNNDVLICPKCGEKLKFDKKIIDNIIISNNELNDILIGIKGQIENIINDINKQKEINYIKSQLKNINRIINNGIDEIKKSNEEINKLNFNQNNYLPKDNNIIKGLLDIKLKDIDRGVILFNKETKMELMYI